jgi:A/G-specific adenine glycosylase
MAEAQPSLPSAARVAVLEWYAPRARAYAWRRGRPSPYRTLVSELMLQQTQASRVEPLFTSFVRRFPTVRALASASRAEVLRAWAGLGYNRRAVALHRAAQTVVEEHRGRVPIDPAALRTLPGVGPYTAAAVASIGGGAPVAAIDVNVRRIVGRVGSGMDDAPVASVDAIAGRWLDRTGPGTWNQALMDLGREHCRARPRCDGCPLAPWCRWRRASADGVATEPAPRRRQSPFTGSTRQVRGRIVDTLRSRPAAGASVLAHATGFSRERVESALGDLVRDGVLDRIGSSYMLAR